MVLFYLFFDDVTDYFLSLLFSHSSHHRNRCNQLQLLPMSVYLRPASTICLFLNILPNNLFILSLLVTPDLSLMLFISVMMRVNVVYLFIQQQSSRDESASQ